MIFLPWMAAQDASPTQKDTPDNSVFQNRLFGVFRACGIKNTGGSFVYGKHPCIEGKKLLVKNNKRNNDFSRKYHYFINFA